MPALILTAVPLVLLAVAVVFDVRCRRLPNWLTLPMALAGFGAAWAQGGWEVLQESLGGFGFFLLMGFLAWSFGFAGGGDGKLVAGIGAWLGFEHSYSFLLLWLIFNLGATLWVTLRAHEWSLSAWWQEQRVGLRSLTLGHISKYGARSYPGAVTLMAAYVVYLLLPWIGLGAFLPM